MFIAGVLAIFTSPIAAEAIECREGFKSVTFIVGATGEVRELCLPSRAVDVGAGGYLGNTSACPVNIAAYITMYSEWVEGCIDDPEALETQAGTEDGQKRDSVLLVSQLTEAPESTVFILTVFWDWQSEEGMAAAGAQAPAPGCTDGSYIYLDDPATARACAAMLFALLENELGFDCGNFPDFEP